MNYKTVLLLIKANQKSYRAIQNAKMRRYHENKLFTYGGYVLACVVGVLVGYVIGNIYVGADLALQTTITDGAGYVFVAMPTIALLYGLFFTQINQAQRMGTKASAQAIYWFPITWQEHTLASIISSLLGTPLGITILISSAVLTVSVFLGLVFFAVLMVLALLASLLLASVTIEIQKTLQIRLLGAITKASGKSAIWLRFVVMMGSMFLIYLIYFSVYNQVSPLFLFEVITKGQGTVWFIPYVWPGMLLFAFANNLWMEVGFFSLATAGFIIGVFFVATYTNTRFGLYELPALRLSNRVYTPKPSLFEKLGLSPIEASLIKKDFKALTRRPELSILFILPIVTFVPIFGSSIIRAQSNGFASMEGYLLFTFIVLGPSLLMASRLGSMLTGVEGRSMWYLFASPISAKMFTKSKIVFTLLLSLAIALICGVIGGIMFRPSPLIMVVVGLEAIFLIVTVTVVSVAIGIKGADFHRDFPHCIKRRENWIYAPLALAVGLAVVAPIVPYALGILFAEANVPVLSGALLSDYYGYIGLFVSGIVATIISYVFCRVAIENAEQMLTKAEPI